jgi:hypothetical protein
VCRYPDKDGTKIYDTFFESEYVGEFDNEDLRRIFLQDVANEIIKKLNRPGSFEYQQVECCKPYSKYGITFANKGDEWNVIGKTEADSAWILKGSDSTIQIIEDKKFQEHFCVQIVVCA